MIIIEQLTILNFTWINEINLIIVFILCINYVLGMVPMTDNSLNTRKKIIHVIGKPQIVKPCGQTAAQLLLESWQSGTNAIFFPPQHPFHLVFIFLSTPSPCNFPPLALLYQSHLPHPLHPLNSLIL